MSTQLFNHISRATAREHKRHTNSNIQKVGHQFFIEILQKKFGKNIEEILLERLLNRIKQDLF